MPHYFVPYTLFYVVVHSLSANVLYSPLNNAVAPSLHVLIRPKLLLSYNTRKVEAKGGYGHGTQRIQWRIPCQGAWVEDMAQRSRNPVNQQPSATFRRHPSPANSPLPARARDSPARARTAGRTTSCSSRPCSSRGCRIACGACRGGGSVGGWV